MSNQTEPTSLDRIANALERIAKVLGKIESRLHDANDNTQGIESAIKNLVCVAEAIAIER